MLAAPDVSVTFYVMNTAWRPISVLFTPAASNTSLADCSVHVNKMILWTEMSCKKLILHCTARWKAAAGTFLHGRKLTRLLNLATPQLVMSQPMFAFWELMENTCCGCNFELKWDWAHVEIAPSFTRTPRPRSEQLGNWDLGQIIISGHRWQTLTHIKRWPFTY